VRRESGRAGHGPAAPGHAAAAHCGDGAGVHRGPVEGHAGELLGTGAEGQA
jgi:hypothetical protein